MLSTCIWCYFEDASKFVHFLQIPGRDSSRKGKHPTKKLKCQIFNSIISSFFTTEEKYTFVILLAVVYFTTAPTVAYNMWSTANNAIFALSAFSISQYPTCPLLTNQKPPFLKPISDWLKYWQIFQLDLIINEMKRGCDASEFSKSTLMCTALCSGNWFEISLQITLHQPVSQWFAHEKDKIYIQ